MKWIQDEFQQRNIRTCLFFIMRDPIERRYHNSGCSLGKGKLNPQDEHHAFIKLADNSSRVQATKRLAQHPKSLHGI